MQRDLPLGSDHSNPLHPTVSVCLIVKNEEVRIDRALGSVAGVVDEIVLVDTGSTDATVEKALRHGARVFHFDWRDDFAAARNHSMDQATGDWILLMDADEELTPADREALIAAASDPSADAFFFSIDHVEEGSGRVVTSTRAIHMVRNRPHFRYVGKVHEQILPVLSAHGAVIKQAPVRMRHYGYQKSVMDEKIKDRRNLRLLERAGVEHGDDPFVLFNLGQEHLAAGDIDKAAEHLIRSLRLTKDFNQDWAPVLFYYLSGCLLQLERYEGVERVLSLGRDLFPQYTELVYREGQLQRAKGALSRALAAYLRCLGMGESPPGYALRINGVGGHLAWYEAGRIYEDLGRLPEAVNAYRCALLDEGRFLPPLSRLLQVLLQRETPERVRDFVLALRPDWTSEAHCLMGAAFADAGAHRVALEILEAAETRGGDRGLSSYQKGWVRAGMGDYTGAMEAWAGIPHDSPLFSRSRFALGIICLFLGEAARARLCFTELGDDPHCASLKTLGRWWADALEGKVVDQGEFRSQPPRSEALKTLFFDLIQLGIRHGQHAFVEAGLSILGRVEPDSGAALARLSTIYFHCGLLDRAVETARGALDLGHRNPDLFNVLGNVARERGLLHDAAALYSESAACDPSNPEVFLALAAVFEEMGQRSRARQVLDWALVHHLPDNQILRARRDSIRTEGADSIGKGAGS